MTKDTILKTGLTVRSRSSRLLSMSGWNSSTLSMGALNLTSMALDFLVLMIIARLLGPASFGLFALAQAAIGLAAASIARASTTSVVKCYSAPDQLERPMFSAFWGFTARASIMAACLTAIAAWWMGAGSASEAQAWILLSVAAAGLLTVASTSVSALNWTFRSPLATHFPNSIVRPLALLFGSLLYFWLLGATVAAALLALATAQLCSFAASFLMRPTGARRNEIAGTQSSRGLWRTSRAVLLAFALTNAAGLAEIIILGLYGRETDVAIFKIALSFTVFVNLGAVVSGLVYSPRIAKAFASKSAEAAQLTALSARMTVVFAVISGAVIAIGAPIVLPFALGIEYSGVIPILYGIVLATVIASAGGAGSNILNMSGETRALNKLLAVVLVTKIVLALSLIPLIGLWGAVLSYSIGLLLLRFLVGVNLRRIIASFDSEDEGLPQ